MGTVFEAQNIRIERRVAIKVLHERVAASPEFAQRFEREARASAQIGSPHVCDVLDLGYLENGQRFIVMEYLEGESLEDRLSRGRLTAEELAPIAFELLEGLGTMHQAGIIHRDLKPANVFLARRAGARAETVKILDFGVAKALPRGDEPSPMTSTGMMIGTPLYMSPEQARGARDVDDRTDIYAASVIFYQALTGAMPHSAANVQELLFKIVLETPRPLLELAPDVDEAFASIVERGLRHEADQRHRSARAYQREIAAWGTRGQTRLPLAGTLALHDASTAPNAALDRPSAMGIPAERTGPPTPGTAPTPGTGTMHAPDRPGTAGSRSKARAVIGASTVVIIGAVVAGWSFAGKSAPPATGLVGTTSVMFDKREVPPLPAVEPPPTADLMPQSSGSSTDAQLAAPSPPSPRRSTAPASARPEPPATSAAPRVSRGAAPGAMVTSATPPSPSASETPPPPTGGRRKFRTSID